MIKLVHCIRGNPARSNRLCDADSKLRELKMASTMTLRSSILPFLLLLVVFLTLPHSSLSQQKTPSPCTTLAEYRQLDFWIGEWEVKNPKGDKVGDSSIQLIVDDCVIFENYTGRQGFAGKSFNVYNQITKKWQQFWVDNRGGVLEFVGEKANTEMRYAGESKDARGGRILHRMTFFDMSRDTVRQLWEQSADGGSQWKTVFDGTYLRKH